MVNIDVTAAVVPVSIFSQSTLFFSPLSSSFFSGFNPTLILAPGDTLGVKEKNKLKP